MEIRTPLTLKFKDQNINGN